MKRSPLKRKSPLKKKKNKKSIDLKEDISTLSLGEFYQEIWDETINKVCYETGQYLGREPLTTMFHHILEKSKYPEYKFCKWNIVLLRPEVHEQVHLNIDKTPKVKALKKK